MGIIFFLVAAGLLYMLFTSGRRAGLGGCQPHEATPAETPLELLGKRYARGEIDRAEYEARRRDLS